MKFISIACLVLIMASTFLYAEWRMDIEAGAAISGYNDARIPNDDISTKFSFTDDFSSPVVASFRANLHYNINENHRLSFLYAPLTIEPSGKADMDINFQGELFPAGEDIDALYKFDSYRLQYRYFFKDQTRFYRSIGLSLKLRDAEILLANGNKTANKTDTGVVPLISFLLAHSLTPSVDLIMDGEALISPYGRAADVLLALDYDVNESVSLRGGYRVLEGGSDIDEVYTFALINYVVLNLRVKI